MSSPKIPVYQPSQTPVNPEISKESQIQADEAARKAKEAQQKGTSASKTILTSGVGVEDEANIKKATLG